MYGVLYIYIYIYIDPYTNLELRAYIECSIHTQNTTFVNGSTYGGGIVLSQMISIFQCNCVYVSTCWNRKYYLFT